MKSSCNELKKLFTSYGFYKSYIKMFFALAIIAFSYDLFIYPIKLVSGGAGGLGIIFNYLFDINPAMVIFIISFFMFLIALFALDLKEIISTLFVAIVYPILINLFSGVSNIVNIDTNHTLVIVIFGAIITGIGQGIIFKNGLNIGGFSVLAKVIYKQTKLSVTFTNALINGAIVLMGGIFIGINMVLYAIVFIVISRFVSEKVILGISNNKTFKIISNKYDVIEKYIHTTLNHDVIIYDAYGAYKENNMKLIMTVVPTAEFGILRDYVKSVDKNAFVFVTNTYEVTKQDINIRKVQK